MPEDEKVSKKRNDHLKRSKRIEEKEKAKLKAKKEKIVEGYIPLHPEIFTLKEDFLQDDFKAAIRNRAESRLKAIVKEESFEIYSLQMFTTEFCKYFRFKMI